MRKVLIVDDDHELREILRNTLEDEGYDVACAADGHEALERLRQLDEPRLVLLDLMMPVMNGWEFRARQSEDPRLARSPVVVMTATYNLEEAAIDAAGVLRKPIEIDELLRTVASHAPRGDQPNDERGDQPRDELGDQFDDEPKTAPRIESPFIEENTPQKSTR